MQMLIAIVAVLVALYLMAIITDAFFVPAIDKLSRRLHLSSDASGATLLAIGSNAPDLFTVLIAVLGLTRHGSIADVGTGTVVGSAIFSVLVIIGATALYRAVKLQWQPVVRDMAFYIVAILMLVFVFIDGRVTLWEAAGFAALYAVYVFTVIKWRKWLKYDDKTITKDIEQESRKGLAAAAYHLCNFIIPDPVKKPQLYPLTFVLAVAAIGGLSWVLVDQVMIIANTLHINATFLALTVIAAGNSVPELLASIAVAKQGRGDMAVGNAIGSNVFTLLFALPVPWMLYMLIYQDKTVTVSDDNFTASLILLLASVAAIAFLLLFRRWKIGQKSGMVLIGLYVAYCVYLAFTVA